MDALLVGSLISDAARVIAFPVLVVVGCAIMIGALELTDLLTRRSGSGLLCVSYVVALPIAVAVPAPLHLGGNAGVIVGGVFIGTVGLAVLLWRTIRGWEGLAVFRQMFAILSRRRNEPPPDRRDT